MLIDSLMKMDYIDIRRIRIKFHCDPVIIVKTTVFPLLVSETTCRTLLVIVTCMCEYVYCVLRSARKDSARVGRARVSPDF